MYCCSWCIGWMAVLSLLKRYSWHALYSSCTVVAAYCCIEEDNCTVSCKCCLISSSLFEASAVGVPSLHWLQLQCNRSILSLHVPLCMFVIEQALCSQLRSFLLWWSSPLAMNFSWHFWELEQFWWKIFSTDLLCLLFCVICMGNCLWYSPTVNIVSQTMNKHISPSWIQHESVPW